jgi:hypothetical protein
LSLLPLASSPAFDHATVMTKSLQFPQMSGNTYVMVVYASPPLNLRLSPGDRAEGVDGNSDAYNTRIRGKETKVPVACQRRLARARSHVPYLEGPVFGS